MKTGSASRHDADLAQVHVHERAHPHPHAHEIAGAPTEARAHGAVTRAGETADAPPFAGELAHALAAPESSTGERRAEAAATGPLTPTLSPPGGARANSWVGGEGECL